MTNISSLSIDPGDTQTIYAGTSGGVYKSVDGGYTWNRIGLININVLSLKIDPKNTQIVYAAANVGSYGINGGIYKSTDGGNTWSKTGLININILSLTIDPQNTQTIYAGADLNYEQKDKVAVFKSVDGGISWNKINNGLPFLRYNCLAINPQDTQAIYVGTNAGIYKSANGGALWTRVLQVQDVTWISIDPVNPQIIYSTGYKPFVYCIYKSLDGGDSWNETIFKQTYVEPTCLIFNPIDTKTLYVGTSDGIIISTNGGASWEKMNNGLPATLDITCMAIDPSNPLAIYAVEKNSGFYRFFITYTITAIAGENGSIFPSGQVVAKEGENKTFFITANADCSIEDVLIDGISIGPVSEYVFRSISSNHEISVTFKAKTQWNSINNGLTCKNIYSIIVSPVDSQTLYIGTDSGGVLRSKDAGKSWALINGGLMSSSIRCLAIDYKNSKIIYAGTNGAIYKSTDGGDSWNNISSNQAYLSSLTILTLNIDPSNSQIIYAGTSGGVYKSVDSGKSWSNKGLITEVVHSLAIDPKSSNTIYAGTDSKVFKSKDGGSSWSLIVTWSENVFSLAIDPSNSQIIYAGTRIGLFKSEDGGLSWNQSQTMKGTVYSICIDPRNTQTVYVGTYRNGVFKSTDGGYVWKDTGLQNYIQNEVYSLAIDSKNTQTVYAGTWGNGVYKYFLLRFLKRYYYSG
ncbi:WD40/YVTN/BNR-like repeat-containing protein [Caldisericum sp.]|uniref:WD40/YVTN/BNR-like repeat-containing protein n=1 Tax=Caldisericum sp. TaxID=2499687 RepID=UPI003D0DD056